MPENLAIITKNIREGDSSYYWLNIELGGTRVGKARIKRVYSRVIIKNLVIFPEFQRHGLARRIIELFKGSAREIIADRVRSSAKGFWEQMGFSNTGDGNYRWLSDHK